MIVKDTKIKKTLIYIIGAGRSGTTFFDIVLGNNEDTISLGEINRFFKRDGIPPKRDPKSEAYLYWKKIRQSFVDSTRQNSFYRLENLFWSNEFHSKYYKSFFKRNNSSYQKTLKELYKSIALNTKESIIIESSKYPTRAMNLSNYLNKDDFEIKYIYLKKDPVKVVKSFNKKDIEQPSKRFLNANVYYLLVNILCYFTIRNTSTRSIRGYTEDDRGCGQYPGAYDHILRRNPDHHTIRSRQRKRSL